MIISYKDRALVTGTSVQVYRNLHNGLFSIRDKTSGLVLSHGTDFSIKDCVFKVSKTGNEKVRYEGRKNVHAWIEGMFAESNAEHSNLPEIYYNPYEMTCFINKVDFGEMERANGVFFSDGKAFLLI